jgi:S1-C subfamily serine protease
MKVTRVSRVVLTLLVLALCLGPAVAQVPMQTTAARGREIVAKFSNAVISVRLVAKVRMAMEGRQMEEQENTSEITATVIDPSGLTVCALSEADPTQAIAGMMADEEGYKFEMDLTDIKLRLADGKELPAKIVLRDKDLDLAFLRPDPAPAQPLTAVDLSASAKTDVLEEMLVLQRLGEVANRVPGAVLDQVEGVIQKPRLMYVPGMNGQSCSLGAPAFALDGKVIGILVNRFPAVTGGREDNSPLTVLLPADDVLEGAKQAPPISKQ